MTFIKKSVLIQKSTKLSDNIFDRLCQYSKINQPFLIHYPEIRVPHLGPIDIDKVLLPIFDHSKHLNLKEESKYSSVMLKGIRQS